MAIYLLHVKGSLVKGSRRSPERKGTRTCRPIQQQKPESSTKGILVNCITPAVIETEIVKH